MPWKSSPVAILVSLCFYKWCYSKCARYILGHLDRFFYNVDSRSGIVALYLIGNYKWMADVLGWSRLYSHHLILKPSLICAYVAFKLAFSRLPRFTQTFSRCSWIQIRPKVLFLINLLVNILIHLWYENLRFSSQTGGSGYGNVCFENFLARWEWNCVLLLNLSLILEKSFLYRCQFTHL